MGLLRIVTWSILGPLIIWMSLVGHVVFRFANLEPEVLKLDDWPTGTKEAFKIEVAEGRSGMIKVSWNQGFSEKELTIRINFQDFQRVLAKGEADKVKAFINTYLDDQFVWEDPMERLEGKKEFSEFMYLSKYVKDIEFEVLGDYHSPRETVMDWKLKVIILLSL